MAGSQGWAAPAPAAGGGGGGLHYVHPLTLNLSKPRSQVCSNWQVLLFESKISFGPLWHLKWVYFSLRAQRTINARPFITLQREAELGYCDWWWERCVYSTQAFACIHTSLKRDFCAAGGVLFCCSLLCSYLLWPSCCATSICFADAAPGREDSKTFHQHKVWTLLKPMSSGGSASWGHVFLLMV